MKTPVSVVVAPSDMPNNDLAHLADGIRDAIARALYNERSALIHHFEFLRDCLPEDAETARRQLEAVAGFLRARRDEEEWKGGDP